MEELQKMIRQACASGTISDGDKHNLQQKANLLGFGAKDLEFLINNELSKTTNNSGLSSGFETTDNNTTDDINSGFVTTTDNTSSGFETNNTVDNSFTDVSVLDSQGAMSIVLRGKRYGKWVIIKRIKPEFKNDQKYRDLFYKEFENAYHLDHPNIIRLLDKGEDAEGPYYSMEFVDGQVLTNMIKQGGVQDKRTVKRVFLQLLEALAYVHKKQIFHRDLKPDNVLVTYRGDNVKILDFGLAAADSFDDDLVKVGTPRYSAPEQMTRGNTVDQRADIYALGLVLLEMLTGDTKDTSAQSVKNEAYQKIVSKCLKTNPNERYFSCDEILEVAQSSDLLTFKKQPEVNTNVQNTAILKREADAYFRDGDYARAKDTYQKILSVNPNDSYALAQIAKCQARLTVGNKDDNKKSSLVPIIIGVLVIAIIGIGGFLFKDDIAALFNKTEIVENEDDNNNTGTDTTETPDDTSSVNGDDNNNGNETQLTAYERYIASADSALKRKHLPKAIGNYEKALGEKPADNYAQGKIDECKQIIKSAGRLFKDKGENNLYGFKWKEYVIIDYLYEDVRRFSDGLCGACKDGKWGFIDETGEVKIAFKFEKITQDFSPGYKAFVFMNGVCWQINKQGRTTKKCP